MFTVLVYLLQGDSLVLVRRITHVLSVEFEYGACSVFVLSSADDDEPDIIPVDSSYYLACCRA